MGSSKQTRSPRYTSLLVSEYRRRLRTMASNHNNSNLSSATISTSTSRRLLSKPKRCLTAYNFFFQQERHRVLDSLPEPPGPRINTRAHRKICFLDLGREIGVRWKKLGPSERVPYQELAAEDKRRYQREMALWYLQQSQEAQRAFQQEQQEQAQQDPDPEELVLAETPAEQVQNHQDESFMSSPLSSSSSHTSVASLVDASTAVAATSSPFTIPSWTDLNAGSTSTTMSTMDLRLQSEEISLRWAPPPPPTLATMVGAPTVSTNYVPHCATKEISTLDTMVATLQQRLAQVRQQEQYLQRRRQAKQAANGENKKPPPTPSYCHRHISNPLSQQLAACLFQHEDMEATKFCGDLGDPMELGVLSSTITNNNKDNSTLRMMRTMEVPVNTKNKNNTNLCDPDWLQGLRNDLGGENVQFLVQTFRL